MNPVFYTFIFDVAHVIRREPLIVREFFTIRGTQNAETAPMGRPCSINRCIVFSPFSIEHQAEVATRDDPEGESVQQITEAMGGRGKSTHDMWRIN